MGLKTAKGRIQHAAYMRNWKDQKRKKLAELLASGKPLPIKTCKKCGQSKPISEFYVGYYFCIPCHNQRSIHWQKENPKRTALSNLRSSRKNKAKRYRAATMWKKANARRHAELNRRWKLRHPEKARALRKASKALHRSRLSQAQGRASAQQIRNRMAMWGNRCWI